MLIVKNRVHIIYILVCCCAVSFNASSEDTDNPVMAQTQTLKPFTSDGCSIFPDGTLEHKDLWLACCSAHDYAYWKGGTYEEKQKADQELKECVAKSGNPKIASLMLVGVQVGGAPYLPTPFRWGYGWPYPQEYKALTDEQKQQVKDATSFKESNKSTKP